MRLNGRAAVVLVAAFASAGLTARLGVWQLDRAAQKIALQQALDERRALPALAPAALARDATQAALQFNRHIRLEGHWLAAATVYLDNRQMNDRPGFFAVTPLMLDDGTAVLVQRGWLPRDPADRRHIVVGPPPRGRVAVQGLIAPRPGRLYEFSGVASGPIRQNLDIAAFAHETGLPLRPLTLVQEDGPETPADGLLRLWPRPAADVQMHYGYAFQWFSLSALIIGLYAWFQVIQPRRRRR
jgi:surfeit locus 1 family protein